MEIEITWGIRSWAEWLGIPMSALDSRVRFRHADAFRHIGRMLYSVPSENALDAPCSPEVDLLFGDLAKREGFSMPSHWPDGRPYAVCVTHDVDRVLCTVHSLKMPIAFRQKLRLMTTAIVPRLRGFNPFHNFGKISAIESEWGIPSALYVLFEKRRVLRSLRHREPQHFIGVYSPKRWMHRFVEMSRRGHEIGIHGSFDSWRLGRQLKKEKLALERAGITDVVGVRNHYLQFDPGGTPGAQDDAGFLYDSTMGYNFVNGFRSGTCFPFRHGGHWELPFQLMDTALDSQFDTWADRTRHAERILDGVRRAGGVLVLNWHFRFMNPDYFPERLSLLRRIVETARADGAWLTVPRTLVGHWKQRLARRGSTLPVPAGTRRAESAAASA